MLDYTVPGSDPEQLFLHCFNEQEKSICEVLQSLLAGCPCCLTSHLFFLYGFWNNGRHSTEFLALEGATVPKKNGTEKIFQKIASICANKDNRGCTSLASKDNSSPREALPFIWGKKNIFIFLEQVCVTCVCVCTCLAYLQMRIHIFSFCPMFWGFVTKLILYTV